MGSKKEHDLTPETDSSSRKRLFLIDWRVVRGLGELKILTRASYAMLLFVPLLAVIWPGIRSSINSYNLAVINSTRLMRDLSREVESTIDGSNNTSASLDSVRVLSGQLHSHMNHVLNNSKDFLVQDLGLPEIWVLAFLASLFVLMAHLVYQVFSPDSIKSQNLSEYIQEKVEHFRKNPPTQTMLDDMIENLKNGVTLTDKFEKSIEGLHDKSADTKKKLTAQVIGKVSKLYYVQSANENFIWSWISCFFYAVSLIVLIYILYSQTLNVLRVAEWL